MKKTQGFDKTRKMGDTSKEEERRINGIQLLTGQTIICDLGDDIKF